MQITKVHGCGNDFVLIGDLGDTLDVSARLVRALCDRHRGVGGDGVIRIAPPRDTRSDVFMDYRNADGGAVEMCGNGVRCVASYLLNRGLLHGDQVRVGSRAGVKTVRVTARDRHGRVSETEVDMGAPEPTGTITLRVPTADGNDVTDIDVVTVSMGNPHAVIEVDDLDKARRATENDAVCRLQGRRTASAISLPASAAWLPGTGVVVGRLRSPASGPGCSVAWERRAGANSRFISGTRLPWSACADRRPYGFASPAFAGFAVSRSFLWWEPKHQRS
jgi:hypothetical protein